MDMSRVEDIEAMGAGDCVDDSRSVRAAVMVMLSRTVMSTWRYLWQSDRAAGTRRFETHLLG